MVLLTLRKDENLRFVKLVKIITTAMEHVKLGASVLRICEDGLPLFRPVSR